ncbi:MAG: hypothetical protein OQK95_09865 [Gammaproteobacteria bacterium]|nr:hypothetical protein [Gammaproteobacteria bacterium]
MKLIFSILLLFVTTNVSSHEEIFKGRYILTYDLDIFTPCGSEEVFWVNHGWPTLISKLKEFYKENTTKPEQSIYIEFRGHYHHEQSDGFQSNYEKVVYISEVIKKAKSIPNDCK